MKGETALKTAQKFRLAEARKNAAGQRLWTGLKKCRAIGSKPADQKKDPASEVLIGGLR